MSPPEESHRGGRQKQAARDHQHVAAALKGQRHNGKRQQENEYGEERRDSSGVCLHIRLRLKLQHSGLRIAIDGAKDRDEAAGVSACRTV